MKGRIKWCGMGPILAPPHYQVPVVDYMAYTDYRHGQQMIFVVVLTVTTREDGGAAFAYFYL